MAKEDKKPVDNNEDQKPTLKAEDLVMDTDGRMVIPMEKRWSTDNFLDGIVRVPTTIL